MKMRDLIIRRRDGKKSPNMWNLARFLYVGGTQVDARWVWNDIAAGKFGAARLERMDLLLAFKDELETRLICGGSYRTISSTISTLQLFIRFLDDKKLSFSLEQLEANYFLYTEDLYFRSSFKNPTISSLTAYDYASVLSSLIGAILNVSISTRLIKRARLPRPKRTVRAVSKATEKQNLESTFIFGNFIADIIAGLSADAIHGAYPLKIPVRIGASKSEVVVLKPLKVKNYEPTKTICSSGRWVEINLRVLAEFMLFIAQTGMNKTQARDVSRDILKYKSLGDSWEVRCYKRRKGGEVAFRIYKSYKPFLEQYRSFLNVFFPHSDLLFPLFSFGGESLSSTRAGLDNPIMLRTLVKEYDIPWLTYRSLRNTRVNWLLRRSGDEDITAEIAQHTKEVLRSRYELPSQQRAMSEITQFWNKHDTIKKGKLKASIIASQCDGHPEALDDKPNSVVEPNCINPSGCLWCKHRRDSDSAEYVWSLASMRYLKTIEATATLTQRKSPSDEAISRLTDMLNWYKSSSQKRAIWVEEAELRVEEGYFHPNWSKIIEFIER